MEEVKQLKKYYRAIRAGNIRLLLEAVNKIGLSKEDFVTIIPPVIKGEEYTLIYYA